MREMTVTAAKPDATGAPSRVRLDREMILAGALELAATPGVSTLSFRELGAHLSVDPTAMYRHFRNKEELMMALLDVLALQGLAEIDGDVEDWRGRLRAFAIATLRQFELYPAIGVEAIVLTTNGPGEHAAIEFILDGFSHAGLSGDELVRHYALLAAHVLSTGSNIARARAGGGTGIWLDQPVLVDPREFPLVAAHSALLAELRDEELYIAGVEVILDSAERTASRA